MTPAPASSTSSSTRPFCNPQAELRKIDLAFQGRVPMRLFFDLTGFEIGVFLIERLRITRQQTTPSGRLTRVELEAELVESGFGGLGGLGGLAGRRRLASPAPSPIRSFEGGADGTGVFSSTPHEAAIAGT